LKILDKLSEVTSVIIGVSLIILLLIDDSKILTLNIFQSKFLSKTLAIFPELVP
jgi:hypothetical protein